jgi:hypothetical protein
VLLDAAHDARRLRQLPEPVRHRGLGAAQRLGRLRLDLLARAEVQRGIGAQPRLHLRQVAVPSARAPRSRISSSMRATSASPVSWIACAVSGSEVWMRSVLS